VAGSAPNPEFVIESGKPQDRLRLARTPESLFRGPQALMPSSSRFYGDLMRTTLEIGDDVFQAAKVRNLAELE
jgi:hypothetical protein